MEPDAEDLAATFLDADAPRRRDLLRNTPATQVGAAVAALGRRRDPAAAQALAAVDTLAEDRAVRKAARRELHRLRAAGITIPVATPGTPAEPAPPAPPPQAAVAEAWATSFDPSGARALWLLVERSLGGVWLAGSILHDTQGLLDLSLVDTTRKRFQRDLDAWRRRPGTTGARLPPQYAMALVGEGVELARARGAALPTQYTRFRQLFGEAERGPERALVYETISPLEARLNPHWLESSAALLVEPELAGWRLAPTDTLRARALEVARAGRAALLIPGNPPEEQARRLLADAARELLTAEARRGLRRRLEETAYLFVATDRPVAARRAAAAAQGFEDGSFQPEAHPLVPPLVLAGLVRSLGDAEVGGQLAAATLLELAGRVSEEGAGPPGAPSTSGGLILPR